MQRSLSFLRHLLRGKFAKYRPVMLADVAAADDTFTTSFGKVYDTRKSRF